MKLDDCMPGAVVRYYPSGRKAPGFIGVVRELPWQLGDGSWVTHLNPMEPAYYRLGAKTTVHAARVDDLDLVSKAGSEMCVRELAPSPAGASPHRCGCVAEHEPSCPEVL